MSKIRKVEMFVVESGFPGLAEMHVTEHGTTR